MASFITKGAPLLDTGSVQVAHDGGKMASMPLAALFSMPKRGIGGTGEILSDYGPEIICSSGPVFRTVLHILPAFEPGPDASLTPQFSLVLKHKSDQPFLRLITDGL